MAKLMSYEDRPERQNAAVTVTVSRREQNHAIYTEKRAICTIRGK